MNEITVDEAKKVLEEQSCIEAYESLVKIVFTRDLSAIDENKYRIPKYRMDILQTLIEAKYLDFQQLQRISKVDNIILNNDISPQYQYLQDWLKTEGLVDKDSTNIYNYTAERIKVKNIKYDPKFDWYSKKSIEFFKRRNEAYLNIWENATIDDLKKYDGDKPRGFAFIRSALQRVFWGNHFIDGELIRLLHADLRLYQDPQADQIASEYTKMFEEVFDQFDIKEHFLKQSKAHAQDMKPTEAIIKSFLNEWDWFTHDWEDWYLNDDQIDKSVEARMYLDEYYRNDALTPQAISELIELDNNALLSSNWLNISGELRLRISEFMLQQGIFDPQEREIKAMTDDNYIYLKQ
ncbi:MAG: hypothetical protein GX106_05970 [Candidatus Cloacimonetes bacterium]|nr:hypothetical protein [Candidatus Cloacimonadota bacterium]